MPLQPHISLPCGVTIALWHLTEEEPALAACLPVEEAKRLAKEALSPKRFYERAATRLLLDSLEATRGAIVAHTAEGQPYLPGRPGHLSISHTRQWVTVAWHPSLPVGIDIERLGSQVERVAPRVLDPTELNAHNDSSQTHRLWLHLCWSAKEALFKAIPEAAIDFREHLHIAPPDTIEKEGIFTAAESRTPARRRYKIWYRTHAEWVMVCATPLP